MTPVARSCAESLGDILRRSRLVGKAMIKMLSSLIRIILPNYHRPKVKRQQIPRHAVASPDSTETHSGLKTFVKEVQQLVHSSLNLTQLLNISDALGKEYRKSLQSSDLSMLPTYHHTLPSGSEQGEFFTLDVGGSTLRIALVRLTGGTRGGATVQIKRVQSFAIDKPVRDLRGRDFFDWVAERISEMLSDYSKLEGVLKGKLDMGLTWSFPVEQTSYSQGRLLAMGKGFCATQGVENQDLGTLVITSCLAKNLNVNVQAIVNDSSATLLSQAYRDPRTRISLVLGTGTNAAVYLPVSVLGSSKFSSRPSSWHANPPSHVLVNTEMSVFGHGIFPLTRWDEELNTAHPMPNLQPLEYLSTGRYLGEIVRLMLLEAIQKHKLFNSQVPHKLDQPYALSAQLLAVFEADPDSELRHASAALQKDHPFPSNGAPTTEDLEAVRAISIAVTTRATAFQACALHALWKLRTEAEGLELGDERARVIIACNGSIVEKYPRYRARVQDYLDTLVKADGMDSMSSNSRARAVTLEIVGEGSVEGAAVACGCA